MIEPKSKLPWVLTKLLGRYLNLDICSLPSDNLVIYGKDAEEKDIEYIVQACNNFPKAVELIRTAVRESRGINNIIYNPLRNEMKEFLKQIDTQ